MNAPERVESTAATRAIVEQAYACGSAGDLAGFAALLADDVVVEEAAGHPCGGTYRGRDEVELALGRILGSIGLSKIDVHDLLVDGARAVALLELTCTDVDGESFLMPAAEAWWVHDGKVTAIRPYYFDTATLTQRCTRSVRSDDVSL